MTKRYKASPKITFFLPALDGGGAERATVNLIREFINRGLNVDLILSRAEGVYLKEIPNKCSIINLSSKRVSTSLPALTRYLQQERPNVMISGLNHANIIAVLAKQLAGVNTEIIVVEHGIYYKYFEDIKSFKRIILTYLTRRTYSKANKIIAVSKGVANGIKNILSQNQMKNVSVIYNPIVDKSLLSKAKQGIDEHWLQEPGFSYIVSVGRLTKAKDYGTLLKAFSIVRSKMKCRLLILGEGEERNDLVNLASELGIKSDLLMPGFVENPYKYISIADVFVMSSRWEGFGNVIVEAMACGVPVISTDCPYGPAEIIDDGKTGILTPVGDVQALSNNIYKLLKDRELNNKLTIAGKRRSEDFTVSLTADKYLDVITAMRGV
ncbi:MAG: glycosyltransferase [Firmicutes bacterium]|nr:glycosyltransferase [Bacillota bacterium]